MNPLPPTEMHRLTRALRTKADKIRTLARAGVGVGDIARFLDIRYQHAYNVLKRARMPVGRDEVRDGDGDDASVPAKAALDTSGRLVLPPHILKAWSASPDDQLLVRLDGDSLHVFTRDAGVRHARDILRKHTSGSSMTTELLAERKRERMRERGRE